MKSVLIPLLMMFSVSAPAKPAGKPPAVPMSFHQHFFGCRLPLEITLQATTAIYRSSVQKSPTQALSKGSRIVVVEAVDVVQLYGLAKIVDPDFENNALALRRDDEVYVLADWEFLYTHAWVNGAEVEGGLPVRDESYFRIVQEPKIEHWIRVHTNSAPTIIWWLKLGAVSRDAQTIKTCESEGF